MADRTQQVPPHRGANVLPCTPLFNRLLRFAARRKPLLCIRDDVAEVEASHLQLLTDVLALRTRLHKALSPDVREALDRDEEVYIAILAGGGYEFTVGMLAVLAIGAAAVPMTPALPPGEAVYYATKSRSVAMLASSASLQRAHALEELLKSADARSTFPCIPILPSTFTPLARLEDITISSDRYLPDNAPGVVIFTSGTTGPPKGSVMRRAYIFDSALAVADHYRLTETDVLLHLLPVHHATGLGIMFFPFLLAGACIEFRSSGAGFDPQWTWDRWRRGGITVFSGVPTVYMRLMRYFQQYIEGGCGAAAYVAGARQLRACLCGTSALPSVIAKFWQDILGRKILLRYGATEFGAVFKVRLDDENVPEGSVGEVVPGLDVKLSDGDEGEIRIKSPYMFSKYMFDEEATARAHDEDGYYRSGDIARREGRYYWILGRAAIDIIKSGGYKISALDIEREIMTLPYISEVTVVGVPDDEFGQRVAAAVVLRKDNLPEISLSDGARSKAKWNVDIGQLREDLGDRLARYKMPTLLTVVEEELPRGSTGKIKKKVLGPKLFPQDYRSLENVQVWNPPTCSVRPKL